MYLTRMRLNAGRRGTQRAMSSPQVFHATLLNSWPDPPTGEDEGRVLWRLDPSGHHPLLYITSPTPPDLTAMVEEMGWPALEERWESASYLPFLDNLEVGQRWRFRLKANPTRSGGKNSSGKSRHSPHVTEEHQREWLLNRAARLGVKEVETRIVGRQIEDFRRGPGRVTLTTATYEGVLEVEDTNLLRQSLVSGIGRAKGYGCGLLTLAR